jgi:cellulose biosynthesis protein BcsQ
MKVIGLVNQKGGAGKTTISLMLAGFLNYYKGKKILFIDADEDQLSVFKQRQEEKHLLESKSGGALRQIVENQKNNELYDVLPITRMEDLQKIDDMVSEREYDYMIIDTKGAVSEKLLKLISIMDIIFIPVAPTQLSARSTNYTTEMLKKIKYKNFYLIWNNYKVTTGTLDDMQNFKRTLLKDLDEHFLNSDIPERVNIGRRNITNTIFYPGDNELKKQAPELLESLNKMYNLINKL